MDKDKLVIGDVVVLKSGGPNMTVAGISRAGVDCTWMNVSGSIRRDSFDIRMLKPESKAICDDEDGEW